MRYVIFALLVAGIGFGCIRLADHGARVIVLEAFGRYAGHTAFRGGIGGDADCVLIPEIPEELKLDPQK